MHKMSLSCDRNLKMHSCIPDLIPNTAIFFSAREDECLGLLWKHISFCIFICHVADVNKNYDIDFRLPILQTHEVFISLEFYSCKTSMILNKKQYVDKTRYTIIRKEFILKLCTTHLFI